MCLVKVVGQWHERWHRAMRRQMARLCLSVLAAAALYAQAPAGTGPAEAEVRDGSIAGHVTSARTGGGIPGLQIYLIGRDQPAPARTDADGRFRFNQLGKYLYGVAIESSSGYISHQSGVDLRSGPRAAEIEVKAYRTSTVSGRVEDARHRPIGGVRVSAWSVIAGGERFHPSRNREAETDDRGEYRITGLLPGRYRLLAERQSAQIQPRMADEKTSHREPVEAEVPTYYPNSSSFEAAMVFNVAVDQVLERMDITIARERTVCAQSRVINSLAGSAAPINLWLHAGPQRIIARAAGVRGPDVEICGLGPGTYELSAWTDEGAAGMRYAAQEFSVTTRNVRVPDLDIQPLIRVPGRLRIDAEGGKQPLNAPVFVELMALGGCATQQRWASVDKEGPFILPAVCPIKYWLDVKAPAGFYVQSASMAGVDVLRQRFLPAGGELDIVLRQDGATLSVQVADTKSRPIPGATVVLGRDPLPVPYAPGDLVLGLSDQAGQAVFHGLAPGAYRAIAHVNIFGFDDLLSPESFSAHAAESERVKLSPKENRTLLVKALDAEQAN